MEINIALCKKEICGVQLNNIEFSKKSFMEYTNTTFKRFWGDDLHLEDVRYSNEAAGYYYLKYTYFPKDYSIEFEHEFLMFSIRIKRNDGAFSTMGHISPHPLPSDLKEENIYASIKLLTENLKNDSIPFYIIKKSRQIRTE